MDSVYVLDYYDLADLIRKNLPSAKQATDATVIWKINPFKINFHHYPRLKYLSTFLSSHQTLTQKDSLIRTGLDVYGSNFYDLHPYAILSNQEINMPSGYLIKYPSLGKFGWIVKPPDWFGGKGINVFWNFKLRNEAISKSKPEYSEHWIVQKYVERPLIIEDRKFDIRMYVLLTQTNIYLYRDGFVRLTGKTYEYRSTDPQINLTNVALIKGLGADLNVRFLDFLIDNGIQIDLIYNFIEQLVPLFQRAQEIEKEEAKNYKFQTFEIVGLDILIDENHKCWLLEINKYPFGPIPSVKKEIYPKLVEDTFKLIFKDDVLSTKYIEL